MGLHVDDPFPIRRNLGEGVALPVARGPGDRLRHPALTVVEGDPVDVVLDLRLFRRVGELRLLGALRIRLAGFRLQKQQVFAVGTPHRAGLHIARVVRARQRLEFPRGLAVPRQNAARGVEHLAEGEVLVARVVEPVVEAADVRPGVLDRSHHVLPVRRNLRHEPEPLSRILRLERVPLDHVFAADRSFLQQWDDRVQPLVVLRAVYVQADGFAVGGKRMAVRAGRETRDQGPAPGRADVLQPPSDELGRGLRQGLDHAPLPLHHNQRHIAIENRRADRIRRRLQRDLGARGLLLLLLVEVAGDGHRGGRLHRVLLDRRPDLFIRLPGVCRGLLWRQFGPDAAGVETALVDRADAHALALGAHPHAARAIAERDLDLPVGDVLARIVPQKSRWQNVGREDRALRRVVDNQARRAAGRRRRLAGRAMRRTELIDHERQRHNRQSHRDQAVYCSHFRTSPPCPQSPGNPWNMSHSTRECC